MKTINKIFKIGALAISLTGCINLPNVYSQRNYLEGIVKKESGSVTKLVESSGASFGNESVKIGYPTYNLQIKTSEGVYTARIIPGVMKSLEALELAIDVGSRVRFPKIVGKCSWLEENAFGEDKIGKIYADDLIVLQ
ncbi:hypothetical protein HYS72_02240 [Candidatus Pacearchaeota archaeon]|nr:hypothetical protein [Candidatus Pacearchaeota archaeon]MBI2056670.1 hypothetical protein [Candidatus Pacearchaeota archaeon]